jgi:hypothetical protein
MSRGVATMLAHTLAVAARSTGHWGFIRDVWETLEFTPAQKSLPA